MSEPELRQKIAESVVAALASAVPHHWVTFDVWAGRTIHNDESKESCHIRVVKDILEQFWPTIRGEIEGIPY